MSEINDVIRTIWARFGKLPPAKQLLFGYLSYAVLGWFLLCLPITHRVSGLSVLDHLFISTSALSTTGLTTISVSDSYNFLGELIILLLIQAGGIGYMTFGSFLVVAVASKLDPVHSQISRAALSIPSSFSVEKFIVNVIRFTLITEGIGALMLAGAFHNAGHGILHSLWSGIFHSVSAFCTAGFSLYNNSFESFTQNVEINVVIALLSFLGAIGFIVCADLANFLELRSKSLTLTSKVIVVFTGGLTVAGTLLIFLFEPSLQSLPEQQRFLPAFFQTMTAMTTVGFNTVPIGHLSKATILIIMVLMIIGASPGGTGGGLKSTTVASILGVMVSIVRGRSEVRLWGQTISAANILTAVAGLGFYLAFLVGGAYLLEMCQSTAGFDQNLFEAASALGTVGLSMGITSSLTVAGKMVIIVLMFSGRVGLLTFGMALLRNDLPNSGASEPELVI